MHAFLPLLLVLYLEPDFIEMLSEIDAFHTPVVDSAETWAEWHYFNYHDDAGRSLYVSISGVAFEGDLAASGYSRGVVLLQYVDADGKRTRMVDVLPGREIAASTMSPDLSVGVNAVRWEGGTYRVNVALSDSVGGLASVAFDLDATPHQYARPITPMGEERPFGYVVPVARGRMTGTVRLNGETIALDGVGYHDHNWGWFRDAVWDWGVVHPGEMTIIYGRFAHTADELEDKPLLFALFDADGPRPFVLTHLYEVEWSGATPRAVTLRSRVGQDKLELRIDVTRQVETRTGEGKPGLFRADPDARSFFIQMEGRARLTGKIDRKSVDVSGHAFAETFRLEP